MTRSVKPSALGRRVVKLRKLGEISARELSRLIGASQSLIGQLERGQIQTLSGDRLVKLAGVLGASAEFLQHGRGPAPGCSEVLAAIRAAAGVSAPVKRARKVAA